MCIDSFILLYFALLFAPYFVYSSSTLRFDNFLLNKNDDDDDSVTVSIASMPAAKTLAAATNRCSFNICIKHVLIYTLTPDTKPDPDYKANPYSVSDLNPDPNLNSVFGNLQIVLHNMSINNQCLYTWLAV